jgi:hypothetical protein
MKSDHMPPPIMPPVLRILGFRFHFYSDEGSEYKFWLSPVVMARNRGMSAIDIRKVDRLIYENQAFLLEEYDDFQSQ